MIGPDALQTLGIMISRLEPSIFRDWRKGNFFRGGKINEGNK